MPKLRKKSSQQKAQLIKSLSQVKRSDRVKRTLEQEGNTKCKKANRLDLEFRKQEEAVRKLRRLKPGVRKYEQAQDTSIRKMRRLQPGVRKHEQAQDTSIRKISRLRSGVRKHEQAQDTSIRKIRRLQPGVRKHEQTQNTAIRKIRRLKPGVRTLEQNMDTKRRSVMRVNANYHKKEQVINTITRRISRKYGRLNNRMKSRNLNKLSSNTEQETDTLRRRVSRKTPQTLEVQINKFLNDIKEGPTWTCSSCGGLWFRSSVTKVNFEELKEKGCPDNFLKQVLTAPMGTVHWLCSTCKKSIVISKVPRLNLSNGLRFPVIPDCLKDLTTLEERLCAMRLPFLQIRSLGVDRQCGLKGNVVHIHNEIDDTVAVLPRRFNEASIIQVQLMRRMDHERPYLFQAIRPAKVFTAVKYLVNTPLYKEEGVTLSDVWERDTKDLQKDLKSTRFTDIPAQKDVDSDDDEPDQEPVNPGGHETMIMPQDPSEIFKIAPGQGKKPMSLLNDINGEIASYPTIYCGEKRNLTLKLSYSEIAKSETRRSDRRCAVPHKLLHAYKISQNTQVANAVSLCLRKKKGVGVTAAQLLNGDSVKKLIDHDCGFRILKQVRTSPAYWEQKTKHICAMIRQLGIPTLFLTLSAAETHWPELLIILKRVLDGVDIDEEEAMNLSYEEKADLIRRDPVTCSRFFDHRLRKCFAHLFRAQNGVFGKFKMSDFFYRIEFQHRGSPHAHIIFWLKHAPKYDPKDPASILNCEEFIDEIISCKANVEGVIHQQHRHTRTCKRQTKDGVVCRFNIPYPPLPRTMILQPFPSDYPKLAKAADKVQLAKVKLYLEEHKKDTKHCLIDEFLTKLEINLDQYLAAIRSGIKRPTVFLKRSIDSCFTNAYMPSLAKAWRSNMDVQFILEPYGCAKYIASYISKSCGGISKLLKATAEEARKGNLTLKENMRKIGNVFLNGSEVSAQEAAYGILGMSLTNCTREAIFIPTGPPDERVFLVKSDAELQKLSGSSEEVAVSGILHHYAQRPDSLETNSLAEFAAYYTFSSKKRLANVRVDQEEPENIEDLIHVEDETCLRFLPLKDKSGYVRKRKMARIIRFRRYGEALEPINYYREQLMLYKPWRDEESELLAIDVETIFLMNYEILDAVRHEFNANMNDLPMEEMVSELESQNSDNRADSKYEVMDGLNLKADIMRELFPEKHLNANERIPSVSMIDDTSYKLLMDSLNNLQRQYTVHVMRRLKKHQDFNDFVYGGAGTGKSTAIKAIVQTVLRHYNISAGCDPSTPKVLLSAPTGKAAYNIRGSTLHQIFMLPLNQFPGPIPKLSDDTCNTLACKLRDLKILIIDEISMVSSEQFYQVSTRMQQIFKTSLPFGGKNVIVVGDFRQLRPVAASYVFSNLKGDLGDLIGNPLWERFQTYELVEIMRQKDDMRFAQALNRLSVGQLTPEDIEMFKSREIRFAGTPTAGSVHLFNDNRSVDEYNTEALSKMTTETVVSEAFDMCQGKGRESWKKALLDSVKNLSTRDTMGLPRTTRLTLDAKYMVTLNVDVIDGLVNGATGVLKKLSYGNTTDGRRIPTVAWMSFDEKDVGKIRKHTYANLLKLNGVKANWIPIQLERRTIKTWPGRDLQAVRAQIPMVPAEAITIHKSQGATFDSVVVHIGKGISRQSLYVACSRAKTLNGLFIVGDFKAPMCRDDDAVEVEMGRLKERSLKFSDTVNSQNAPETMSFLSNCISETLKTISPSELIEIDTSVHSVPNFNNDEPITSVGAITIYNRDINTLNSRMWLSDAIVDAYINLVAFRSLNNNALCSITNFGTYFHEFLARDSVIARTDWVVETSSELLIFPICMANHWTVVIADRNTMTIYEYDPLNKVCRHGNILENIRSFLTRVDTIHRPSFGIWITSETRRHDLPLQTNDYDCGLFIARYIDYLAQGLIPNFKETEMVEFRIFVKTSILNNTL